MKLICIEIEPIDYFFFARANLSAKCPSWCAYEVLFQLFIGTTQVTIPKALEAICFQPLTCKNFYLILALLMRLLRFYRRIIDESRDLANIRYDVECYPQVIAAEDELLPIGSVRILSFCSSHAQKLQRRGLM